MCVRLLLRTRAQLSRAEEAHRNAQAEHSQQWQQHVAGMERNFVTQLAAQEGQLAEQARTYEAQLAEQATAFETRFAEQAESLQERVDHYLAAVSRLGEEQLPDAMRRLRAGDAIDDILPAVEQRVKAGADLQAELGKVIRTALIGIEAEIDRSTSAEQAVIGVGNRIHVLTSKLRGRLHDMQGEHGGCRPSPGA